MPTSVPQHILALAVVVVIATSCSTAPEEEPGEATLGITRDERPEVAERSPADAIVVSSFVGQTRDLAMFVRWEESGSAQLRGELRVTETEGCKSADPGSPQRDAYRSDFKGTRDGSTVFLDLSPQTPGAPDGTWVGELVEASEGSNATDGPALRLRDPDGDRTLLGEGSEQDYLNAVARLEQAPCEGAP
jgi:hypothetical protein